MAGETIVKWGTQKTLEANGAAIASTAIVQADDASYSLVADGGYYPDAEFVLAAAFSVAPTEGGVIALYARPINVDGTADTEVPEATRQNVYVGSFVANNVTATQYMTCIGYDLPKEAEYYLHNVGGGQTMSAGWTLKVTPRTYGTAA